MLAESALLQRTAAQWASPISLVRWEPGPWASGEGTGDLGQVLLAGATLPFPLLEACGHQSLWLSGVSRRLCGVGAAPPCPLLLEACGHQSLLLSAVSRRLCGVLCEAHGVCAHLPVLTAGFAPRKGVAPVSWRGGCLSVWYVTVTLLLRKRASRLGLSASPEPVGRHRGDKDLQAELGPRRVNVSPRQARALTSRLQEGPLRPGRGVSGLTW